MNEVSKKSVNGGSQISGGFIFDQMDRFAHDYLKKEQNIKGYLFTECAHVHYSRQICDFGNVKIVPYETYYVGSAIVVTVKVVDKNEKKEYATGMFFFVEKDHAYCDTKGNK